jgi:hypothetical protein
MLLDWLMQRPRAPAAAPANPPAVATGLGLLGLVLGVTGALLSGGDEQAAAKDDPLARTPEPYEFSHPTWAVFWDD